MNFILSNTNTSIESKDSLIDNEIKCFHIIIETVFFSTWFLIHILSWNKKLLHLNAWKVNNSIKSVSIRGSLKSKTMRFL